MICTIDSNSGFCFGVTRAIRTAEEELRKAALCFLGDIVHNGQEVARLEGLGLQTIDNDDLRSLPPHSRVLLRAHGEPPSTYWIAQQRGIEVIDATCPVVKKLQDRIRACYELHKNDEAVPPQIVIYGKRGHAEVIGLQGQTNNTAIVIEREEEADEQHRHRHRARGGVGPTRFLETDISLLADHKERGRFSEPRRGNKISNLKS